MSMFTKQFFNLDIYVFSRFFPYVFSVAKRVFVSIFSVVLIPRVLWKDRNSRW